MSCHRVDDAADQNDEYQQVQRQPQHPPTPWMDGGTCCGGLWQCGTSQDTDGAWFQPRQGRPERMDGKAIIRGYPWKGHFQGRGM